MPPRVRSQSSFSGGLRWPPWWSKTWWARCVARWWALRSAHDGFSVHSGRVFRSTPVTTMLPVSPQS